MQFIKPIKDKLRTIHTLKRGEVLSVTDQLGITFEWRREGVFAPHYRNPANPEMIEWYTLVISWHGLRIEFLSCVNRNTTIETFLLWNDFLYGLTYECTPEAHSYMLTDHSHFTNFYTHRFFDPMPLNTLYGRMKEHNDRMNDRNRLPYCEVSFK